METEAFKSVPSELLPENIEVRIRDMLVAAEFVPNATPDTILSSADISDDGHHPEAYLLTTSPGLDIVVSRKAIPKLEWESDDEYRQALQHRLDEQPIDAPWRETRPEYRLNGLLEERSKKVSLQEEDGAHEYDIYVMTSPDRFNRVMEMKGKQPGVDSLQLTTVDAGKFSAKASAEAAAQLKILIAQDTVLYVTHDRRLDDHIQAWWSMPSSVALRLQQRALDVLATGNHDDIANFSDGLDKLQKLSNRLIPDLFKLVDDSWEEVDSVEDKVGRSQDLIQNVCQFKEVPSYIDRFSAISVALIETGLMSELPIDGVDDDRAVLWPKTSDGRVDPSSPELLRAQKEMASIAAEYGENIINMMAWADGHEDSELAQKLQAAFRLAA